MNKESRLKNAFGHFKTITNHKLLVMKYCFKLGLYKQGLLHDLSKYTWVEFRTGIRYYDGTRSPNGIEKIREGCSEAWLHHKGRNKHHFEYWIDYGVNGDNGLIGMKMPKKYVVEMFIDRMCACKNYEKGKYTYESPLTYYERGKKHYIIHEESRNLLEFSLKKLASDGEEKTLAYIKNNLLKNVNN